MTTKKAKENDRFFGDMILLQKNVLNDKLENWKKGEGVFTKHAVITN